MVASSQRIHSAWNQWTCGPSLSLRWAYDILLISIWLTLFISSYTCNALNKPRHAFLAPFPPTVVLPLYSRRHSYPPPLLQATPQSPLVDTLPSNAPNLRLDSPAKVNLFLRVLEKQASGFHSLASLFHTVSLSDTLFFSLLPNENAPTSMPKDCFTIQDPSSSFNASRIPLDGSNLVLRALQEFRRQTGIHQAFNVTLQKSIPVLAGLGGGSSNAATALWAANALTGKPATRKQLSEWGASIGSDVPFFFSNGIAYCTGRGEKVQDVKALPNLHSNILYIFKANVGLSTAAVFQNLDPSHVHTEAPIKLLEMFLSKESNAHFIPSKAFLNDLEKPAFSFVPLLRQIKDVLLQGCGFESVSMSGSGTALYAIGEPTQKSELEALRLHFPGLSVFRCTFISRDPSEWYATEGVGFESL